MLFTPLRSVILRTRYKEPNQRSPVGNGIRVHRLCPCPALLLTPEVTLGIYWDLRGFWKPGKQLLKCLLLLTVTRGLGSKAASCELRVDPGSPATTHSSRLPGSAPASFLCVSINACNPALNENKQMCSLQGVQVGMM